MKKNTSTNQAEPTSTLINQDCLTALKKLPSESLDCLVTDPPYGLSKEPDINQVLTHWLNDTEYKHPSNGFMGKEWDSFVPSPIIWKEVFRVLKHGTYGVVFASSRTHGLMEMALRIAGFSIVDSGDWLYSTGFPKNMNISKAIDKKLGAIRPKVKIKGKNFRNPKSVNSGNNIVGADRKWQQEANENGYHYKDSDTPLTPEAEKWNGYGTGLKPAKEPFIIIQKPRKGTYANNILKFGAGALNIEDSRVENVFGDKGRFPANVIHDGSPEVLKVIGSGAKVYHCAKPSIKEKNEGLLNLPTKQKTFNGKSSASSKDKKGVEEKFTTKPQSNFHPTVKPVSLMQYLCKLVCPQNGTVLDPFMGSGSTGVAALSEGFSFTGLEIDKEYFNLAKHRIDNFKHETFSKAA
jgi:site-specific DNA-methyltransferase (adenine-specific)